MYDNDRDLNSSRLILGIDIGDNSSCVAVYNTAVKNAEIVDFSGGYGHAAVSTMIQFNPGADEWAFGENAVMNIGDSDEINISGLVSLLRCGEGVKIKDVYYPAYKLLSMFVKKLLEMVCYINPNSEISKVVISCDDYISKNVQLKFSESLEYAGLGSGDILFKSDSECILAKILYDEGLTNGKVIILDYGSRAFRGKVFDVDLRYDCVSAKVDAFDFDDEIGTSSIENDVLSLITTYYCEETGLREENFPYETRARLEQFSRSHKDLFFQKGILTKPVQLYYNFAYPPFRKTVTSEVSKQLIDRYRRRLTSFLDKFAKHNGDVLPIVFCAGSGFEMFWAREMVKEFFKDCTILCQKGPSGAHAEGAALIGASAMGICKLKNVEINDFYKSITDIGILAKSNNEMKFLPLIEEGSHISTGINRQVVILTEGTETPVYIDIYSKSSSTKSDPKLIEHILVPELPVRPKGTMKLSVGLKFVNQSELEVTLSDEGFGGIFPKTDYAYSVKMCLE